METLSAARAAAARIKAKHIPAHLEKQAVLGLIRRIAGESYASRFIIEPLAEEQPGEDRYRLSDEADGSIRLEATSGTAAACAFNWYLKNRCGSYVGPLTRRLNLPAVPPPVGSVQEERSAFLYRYFLNFCTYGYTFAFWNWEQWAPFLDWMMLSGYNLVLNPVGHELVWIALLQRHGYTEQEARDYVAGPAFFPWQCMMNLTSWGGPAPASWYENRRVLSRKITDYLLSFGAAPVFPGYAGMVPPDFGERHPASRPLDQGLWCDFPRPSILLPADPAFDGIAADFYAIQRDLYGDAHYFAADPFHEGGNAEGVDMAAYARGCYRQMGRVSDSPVWFLQGWQSNPSRELLRALSPENVLIGNLRAEDCADGGDDFAGYPWLYGCVNNFGGQRVTRGNLRKLLLEPHRYAADPACSMVGIALLPEGVETDEILFDAVADLAVRQTAPAEEAWLEACLTQRYGACPAPVLEGWRILKNEVYLADTSVSPRESAFCCRPSLTANMVSSYSLPTFNYDTRRLEEACRLLLQGWEALRDSEPYRLDITDFVRQALANKAWGYVEGLQKAFTDKKVAAFDACADAFLSLYPIQEALVSTNRHMLLGPWLELAKACGHTPEEKAYFEWQARTLLTLWGDRQGAIGLRDYAAREWGGLLGDFYKPRWDSYIRLLRIALLTGREIAEYSRYDAEYFFTTLGDTYPTEPTGDLRTALDAAMAAL